MKKITLSSLLITFLSFSQNTVTVDVSSKWVGYMNVFDNPADASPDCGGAFCFGSDWDLGDLKTVIGASNITLQPNFQTYNASDSYWSNGAQGNKLLEASTFVEPGATFNGSDLTFTGNVVSNTLDAGYTAKFFIKALNPSAGYADALGGTKVVDLPASGNFTVTATATELAPGLIIQYGFVVNGLNANPADEATLGSVVVEGVSLGVNELNADTFKTYPNPSTNHWNIKTHNLKMNAVQVFDMLGKQVMALKPESSEVTIEASQLKSGLYFAKITTELGMSSIKLIKK